MFKKLKKRRLSLSFKKKSSSLKDINIVETFVHKTAKIMSASAENLNSESASSVNLITLLDQSFQPNAKHSTAPNSSFGSPNCNTKFCYHKSKSHSMENNVNQQKEIQINNFYFLNDSTNIDKSQSIEVIFEENNSYSEIMNSLAPCDDNNEMKQSISSGIFDSPQHVIGKHSLKRSFSFNDINFRHMSLKKKHGSIQTFISTNATLSIEIENKPESYETLSSEDLRVDKESGTREPPIKIIHHDSCFGIIGKCIFHPIFLSGIFITGIIILVPTINNKITDWLSSTAITQQIENKTTESLPLLQPLGPEFLFTQPPPSIIRLESRILQDHQLDRESSIVISFLPKIFIEQIKKGSIFLSKLYRKD